MIAFQAFDTAQHGVVGPPRPPNETEQGQYHGYEYALDHADQGDTEKTDESEGKLAAAQMI